MRFVRSLCVQAAALALLLSMAPLAGAQVLSASLRGQVTDPSGAAIPAASVTLSNGPTVKVVNTDEQGRYVVPGVPDGTYLLRISAVGFGLFEKTGVQVSAGRTVTVDAQLAVTLDRQEVTVADRAQVDTDPANNAGALVLRGQDLEALSENPDDLASDLQALAGPAAGPNGGQIFIDGFTGGRLPPRESIREIRINSNPFSAEYDRLGFGRIEVFTKPGTDKFRGQTFFNFGDEVFNSRNPFALIRAPYQTRQFGGNISGPINKRSSFFLDVERRSIDENAVVNARTLDPASLQPTIFSSVLVTPNTRTSVNPRFDYALNANNTLVFRYGYSFAEALNEGVGELSLLSRAYNRDDSDHTVQVTETAILSPRAVNEVRFQYLRSRLGQYADNSVAAINVLESFTGGGNQIGLARNDSDRYEIADNLSITLGTHTLRVGGRVRRVSLSDLSPQNFGGTFTFTGGVVPGLNGPERVSSLEQYRRTLLLQRQGLSPAEIRLQGGGANQFTLSSGDPLAAISQTDVGVFVQDDWRLRQNLTLSLGLRYENQTNLSSNFNFAPRVGFAYAFGGNQRQGRRPTVIRGGFGIFYDRFQESLSLQALRLNGVTQQQFTVINPDFFPNVPTPASLQGNLVQQSVRRIDLSLNAPYVAQTAIGVERQLPFSTTLSVNYTHSRGIHLLRSRNINAPLPGTFDPRDRTSGVRPFGGIVNVYLYESSGVSRQNQLLTNINTRVGRGLTLFAFYVYGRASSDTDSAGLFPSDTYDLSSEYGRAGFDVRHRAFIGSSFTAPYAVRFSPFITMSSGAPVNITTGQDLNGDLQFTERPYLLGPDCADKFSRTCYSSTPTAGAVVLPRNFAEGPGRFGVNLRVSRTWGFGERPTSATAAGDGEGPRGPMFGGGPGGGGPRGGGGGGGFRGGRGGGPGGFFGEGGGSSRYNLTLTVSARNLLNNVNLSNPIGNLNSPLFGQSIATAGGFGPGGGGGAAGNRRVEFQLRFSF